MLPCCDFEVGTLPSSQPRSHFFWFKTSRLGLFARLAIYLRDRHILCSTLLPAPVTPALILTSLPILNHHVRHLNVLFCRILRINLKDDILLMTWDRFLRHRFEQLGHPKSHKSAQKSFLHFHENRQVNTHFIGILSFNLLGG
jgi:hypothetical protein